MIDESQFPLTINDYVFMKRIGNGGSASCYLVESLKFKINKLFVAKVIPFSQLSSITAENEALSGLNHPNIIKLYDRFTYSSFYVLILEYCENKSLAEAIIQDQGIYNCQNYINDTQKPNNLEIFKNYAYQVVNALAFCHMKKCAHRDIKPSNVLIDHYGRLKLADFGLSIKYQNNRIFDYEYEYEEDESDKNSKSLKQLPNENDFSISKFKIPLMTPLTNDTAINSQDSFETKIYYFNNVPLKRRKRSSDTDQTKISYKNIDFTPDEKMPIHIEKSKVKIKTIDSNLNNNMQQTHFNKNMRKRKIRCNSFCGSLIYTAPEIILRKSYDPFSADIWSLGVLFIVMITGNSPWEGKNHDQIQEKILKREISNDVLNKIPKDALELINKMIVVDPKMRSTIEEIRSSSFFDDPCILSTKSEFSTQTSKKIKMLQKKSHSYNSNITHLTHFRLQNHAKENPLNISSFKKLPAFRRPSQLQISVKPMIRSSLSFVRKDQPVKSPTSSFFPNYKKSIQLNPTSPVLNSSPIQQLEQISVNETNTQENNEEAQAECQDNQQKQGNLIEESESLQFLLQQSQKQKEKVSKNPSEEKQQLSDKIEGFQGEMAQIPRCQSLYSPKIVHFH